MAVMPMKRISIYALKNRRKQILELIQRRGVVEIDDRKADETVFAKMDTVPAKSRFENKNIYTNNEMTSKDIDKYCVLDDKSREIKSVRTTARKFSACRHKSVRWSRG